MSKLIATLAISGANTIVGEAEAQLKAAIDKFGPDQTVAFPNTAYYLPTIYGLTGSKVEKLGDMVSVLSHARNLTPAAPPAEQLWLPYLGPTLDAGMATLLAEEIIEGIRSLNGHWPEQAPWGTYNGPIDDVRLRAWGVQLVDGRMPGCAVIVGTAPSNAVAVKIVRELQAKGILVCLAGKSAERADGKSIVDQLIEEGVELGYDTFTVPFGSDTISTVHALGFATRSALTFGGVKPGRSEDILLFNKYRCFAFVLALGQVDALKVATAAGALNFGFPTIADTAIPSILPNGLTIYEAVVAMPWDEIPGDDMEKAERLVQRAIEVRGVKIKISKVPIPVAYGSAFEGERVRREQLRLECGGKSSPCFELLAMADSADVEDGKITVVGPDLDEVPVGGSLPLAIMVKVTGRKMQKDFEPVLERQIHHFVNNAEGVQHIGQRDITWVRLSQNAADKGFRLKHIGDIVHARLHSEFSAIVDKVQVTLYTTLDQVLEERELAREVYRARNERAAALTDEAVDTFYSCTLCQSFAPNHVCVVNPERVGLCGAYNWFDCKASSEINPTGPNKAVPKGACLDPIKGEWDNVNKFVYQHSNQNFERLTFYSLLDAPMTSCGCFECIMIMIPEANGVMVVSREDTSMTPSGMTFSTLAGMAGGGLQTPGMMGHGKYYLTSKKFLLAEGGFQRVVWLSSNIKEQMAEELAEVAAREGVPDLLDKIADERVATTVEDLLVYLEEKGHPALTMEPMF